MKRIAIAVSMVVLLFGVAIETWARSETTVIGNNTYPADFDAVQDAVDKFNIVTLSGTFNFGQASIDWDNNGQIISTTPAGMVTISQPNVLLKADETTGATIIGGGAPSFFDFIWPVINITAPGVTVRGLTLESIFDSGILISSVLSNQPFGRTITLENNTIVAAPFGPIIAWNRGGWPLLVRNNKVSGVWGIADVSASVTINQDGKNVQRMSPLAILDNDVTANFGDGILVAPWNTYPEGMYPEDLPPDTNFADWGDNGPVAITGNKITMTESASFCGICAGRSAYGLNHSLVAYNTIRGTAYQGIARFPYGHDVRILGNDLSGFEGGSAQIAVYGRETTVAKNILGRVGPSGVPMLIDSINMHPVPPPDDLGTPMPLPLEESIIMDNDYRRSNCPGWSQGHGCVLVASEADLQLWTGAGTEVRNNFIFEWKFPKGTGGPSNQIQVGPEPLVHDNRIVGLPSNHVRDPWIGQRIREILKAMSQDKTKLGIEMMKKHKPGR